MKKTKSGYYGGATCIKISMADRDRDVLNAYFKWLCDIVNVNQRDASYFILAKTLHKKEFFWTIPNDDNRGTDGKKLRDKFLDDYEDTVGRHLDDVLEGPCTMLELLIGIAKRMEDIMSDPEHGDRTSLWFWEMMHNCGLDLYTDEAYVSLEKTITIDQILNKILERTYRMSGKNGLFPLKEPKKDQRKVEIWYQMCAYIMENYYVDGDIM